MAFCLHFQERIFTKVNVQEFGQVCAFSTTDTDRELKVLSILGNREQFNDVDFSFINGTPIKFNEAGVFVFEDIPLNTCINFIAAYKKTGEYLFNAALLDKNTNELLDLVVSTVTVTE